MVSGAVVSGLLLSAAFPPLEWHALAWVALIPMLLVPVPATFRGRCLLGYLWGYCHAATSLSWLNEVGFGAGYLLAVYCALYPMTWYVLAVGVGRWGGGDSPPAPRWCIADSRPAIGQGGTVLLLAALWVALEWVRSWLFSGFPWNELGISQWTRIGLLRLTTVTGVYGISFLLVAVNVGVAMAVRGWWTGRREKRKPAYSRALGTVAVLMLLAGAVLVSTSPPASHPVDTLRVLVVQGNIPQCRQWTEEQFQEALDAYCSLTALTAPVAKPDLIVWPESAIPAAVGYEPYRVRLKALLAAVRTPMLIGALDTRRSPAAVWAGQDWDPPAKDFNSVILFDASGKVQTIYDKMHLVPFGEYVPFGRYLPWLVDWIGMGRDLSAGREFTIFSPKPNLRIGVNICFEDAFPAISRGFARRGANVLMTLTNDAWYAESAGSRQHMIHAVFRAAETRLPLLRSGNNSDSCLIHRDGRVEGLLYDRVTGNRFIRGTRVYTVPIYADCPPTLYTRYGDWFAVLCAVVSLACCCLLGGLMLQRACRRRQAIRPEETFSDTPAEGA